MGKHYSKTAGGFYDDELHQAMPEDAVEVSDDQYVALLAAQADGKMIVAGTGGMPIAADRPAPTPTQVAAALSTAVAARIDTVSQALGYDNILSAISYANEPSVPKYQAEGAALRAWRSAAWAVVTPQLDAVIAGGTAPTADALLASLPPFSAPTA